MQEPNRPDNDAITAHMRKIRGEFIAVLHRGGRFDGKNAKMPSIAPALMRNVMNMASANGLSPEEALLVLSFEALKMVELLNDQILEYHLTTPHPRLMDWPGGLRQSNAMHPGR